MHQESSVADPRVLLRVLDIDRPLSNTGLSFGIRLQGQYCPTTAVAWYRCRVIFTQDQLSDSAMDTIGADQNVTIMCTPIRTVVIVSALDNDKYRALRQTERGRANWTQQASTFLAANAYKCMVKDPSSL